LPRFKGFLVGEESFLWTRRGLLKIRELEHADLVLGIDSKGKPSWSALSHRRHGKDQILRITTDGSEAVISVSSEVFTVSGIKRASNLVKGEILETYNIPRQVREMLDTKYKHADSEVGPLKLDSKLGYILGTQIRSRKFKNKIVISGINPEHAYMLANLCHDTLREQYVNSKIYYTRGGKRVRIDSPILADICSGISESSIPLTIREAPSSTLQGFICGILDMILYRSEAEVPPFYFITLAKHSEFRRFIFNILRISGVIPAKTYVIRPKTGLAYFKTFINTSDLFRLGVKFVRSEKKVVRKKADFKPISYSSVRGMSQFRGDVFYLTEPQLHWSLVVDLVPLHRQVLKEL